MNRTTARTPSIATWPTTTATCRVHTGERFDSAPCSKTTPSAAGAAPSNQKQFCHPITEPTCRPRPTLSETCFSSSHRATRGLDARLAEGRVATYYYYDEVTWSWRAGARVADLVPLCAVHGSRARSSAPRVAAAATPRSGKPSRPRTSLVRATLPPAFSANIHAVGVGRLDGGYCVSGLRRRAGAELWPGAGARRCRPRTSASRRPERDGGGVFMSDAEPGSNEAWGVTPTHPRAAGGHRRVISGANVNLTGQSGTIGYFCTRRAGGRGAGGLPAHNTHVFADTQGQCRRRRFDRPAEPGEPSDNRPVGSLFQLLFAEVRGRRGRAQPR